MIAPSSTNLPYLWSKWHNQNSFHFWIEMLHETSHPLFIHCCWDRRNFSKGPTEASSLHHNTSRHFYSWLLWGMVETDDASLPCPPLSAAVISAALTSFIDPTTHRNVTHHPLKFVHADCSAKHFCLLLVCSCLLSAAQSWTHNVFPFQFFLKWKQYSSNFDNVKLGLAGVSTKCCWAHKL